MRSCPPIAAAIIIRIICRGHKRSRAAGGMAQYYGIDITEIDGFDNLHHAEGILQKAQQRANRLYGEEGTETFFWSMGVPAVCWLLS